MTEGCLIATSYVSISVPGGLFSNGSGPTTELAYVAAVGVTSLLIPSKRPEVLSAAARPWALAARLNAKVWR